ncbi:MAG: PqqD family protein, partial [Gammaproteobacteria bacterium]|nr:PqqD family protein [Gammaproteobacteria bacterium]
AVQAAQALLGFECWHPAYVSAKSYLLMSRYNFDDAYSVKADIDLVMKKKLIDLYKKHGCWTWFKNFEKDDTEVFYNNINIRVKGLAESQIPYLALVKINVEMVFRSHNKISKKILKTFADQLIPKINDRYRLKNTGKQFTLSEPGTNTKTVLSDTAAVILGVCDGTKTVTMLVECLCSLYEMEANDLEVDIYDSLIEFNIRGIASLSINAN